jgi:hypothetical protein
MKVKDGWWRKEGAGWWRKEEDEGRMKKKGLRMVMKGR